MSIRDQTTRLRTSVTTQREAAMTCTCPRVHTADGKQRFGFDPACPQHGAIQPGEWRGPECGWAFSRSER